MLLATVERVNWAQTRSKIGEPAKLEPIERWTISPEVGMYSRTVAGPVPLDNCSLLSPST
jgi:hypothetical protein